MNFGIHIGTRGWLTTRMFIGTAYDMRDDAAAFAAVAVEHLILNTQQPTIEATLDVQQQPFAEDAIRKSS